MIEVDGEILTLAQYAARIGMPYEKTYRNLIRQGLPKVFRTDLIRSV